MKTIRGFGIILVATIILLLADEINCTTTAASTATTASTASTASSTTTSYQTTSAASAVELNIFIKVMSCLLPVALHRLL